MSSDRNVKILKKQKDRHEKKGGNLNSNSTVFKKCILSTREYKEQWEQETEKICVLEREFYSLARPAASEEQHSAAQGHHGLCLTGTTHLKDRDIKPAGCEGSPSGSWLLLGSLEYLTFLISRKEPERFLAGEGRQRKQMSRFSMTYGLLEERDT